MLTAVIVDDEIAAIKSIELIAKNYCTEITIVGSAQTAQEGVNLILKTDPDLVFLDVEMPKGSGFDLLEAIPERKFEVVFTTAYNHYAIKAFKYSAVDYLMKPISIDEFIEAVGKVQRIKSNSIDTRSKYLALFENLNNSLPNKLIITNAKGFDHVDIDKLLYIEKAGTSTIICEVGGGTTTSLRLFSEYEDVLFDRNFFKLNSTTMVNLLHVTNVNKSTKIITLSGGITIPVAADKLPMLVSSVERIWN